MRLFHCLPRTIQRRALGTLWSVFLLHTLVAAQNDAWHVDNIWPLATERIDPVVSPNGVSSHMHRIIGGSQFGASYDGKEYEQASCSSASIQADKSNYWMPTMYWMRNGTFIPLASGMRFYMVLGRNKPTEPVKPFPRGLQMVAGNANAKSAVMSTAGLPVTSFTCQKDHFKEVRLDKTMDNWNFETDCPEGLKTEIYFPPCWDGVNLYKPDNSHMAYAEARGLNACPFSHPVRLPHILLEYVWHVESVAPGVPMKGNLVWSNGDTTGYGVHADFINGWDTDVLNKALNDPACVGIKQPMPMSSCPSLSIHMDLGAAKSCQPQKGVLQDPANVADGTPLKALPGCNLLWPSGAKPQCNPAPPALSLPDSLKGTPGPLVAPAGTTLPPRTGGTSEDGWENLGCLGAEGTVTSMISFNSPKMTISKCQSFCRELGKPYCAIGWGYVCQAGDAFKTSASIIDKCNINCFGNSSETCGGNGLIQLYHNDKVVKPQPTNPNPSWMGCRRGFGSITEVLTAGTLAWPLISVSTCKAYCKARGSSIAGMMFGTHCSCGSSFANSGGIPAPGWACDMPCKGNSKEMCGGANVMSTYNTTIQGNDAPASSISSSSNASPVVSQSSVSPSSASRTSSSSVAGAISSIGSNQCATITVTKTVTTCTATVTTRLRRRHLQNQKL